MEEERRSERGDRESRQMCRDDRADGKRDELQRLNKERLSKHSQLAS